MKNKTQQLKQIEDFIYNLDLKKAMKEQPMLLNKIINLVSSQIENDVPEVDVNEIDRAQGLTLEKQKSFVTK